MTELVDRLLHLSCLESALVGKREFLLLLVPLMIPLLVATSFPVVDRVQATLEAFLFLLLALTLTDLLQLWNQVHLLGELSEVFTSIIVDEDESSSVDR